MKEFQQFNQLFGLYLKKVALIGSGTIRNSYPFKRHPTLQQSNINSQRAELFSSGPSQQHMPSAEAEDEDSFEEPLLLSQVNGLLS